MKLVVQTAALLAGLVLVLALTLGAFGLPILPSLQLILDGAFGDRFSISRTLVKMTPLLLCGLGVLVAWRAGMYNIGGEGQFIMGGLAGATVAKLVGTPESGAELTAMVLAASLIGGGLWALLAGWLFTTRGVEVVISTILLNFVALQLLLWSISGPLQESRRQNFFTDRLPPGAMLPRWDRQMDLHAGIVIGLVAAVLLSLYFTSTKSGFRMRLVGANPKAARANRISAPKMQLLAMALSGALCGLAGGVEYAGIARQLAGGFSANWGFLAIPVALLGQLNPLGVVMSSAYFGALFAGSEYLARFSKDGAIGTSVIFVLQGIAVLAFVAYRSLSEKQKHGIPEQDPPALQEIKL